MYVANSNNMTTIEEIKVIGCQVAQVDVNAYCSLQKVKPKRKKLDYFHKNNVYSLVRFSRLAVLTKTGKKQSKQQELLVFTMMMIL